MGELSSPARLVREDGRGEARDRETSEEIVVSIIFVRGPDLNAHHPYAPLVCPACVRAPGPGTSGPDPGARQLGDGI